MCVFADKAVCLYFILLIIRLYGVSGIQIEPAIPDLEAELATAPWWLLLPQTAWPRLSKAIQLIACITDTSR